MAWAYSAFKKDVGIMKTDSKNSEPILKKVQ